MPVIVHLSDIHFGAHRDALAASLLDDIGAHHPDLVVVSGDLTQRARTVEFRRARSFLDRLPAAVLTVVGNHDLPLFHLPRRFLTETRRYERHITRDLDPVLTLPGLAVVGLDTMPSWRWKAGHVSPRQTALVRDVLGSAAPGAWRILVTHHPVLPSHHSGFVGRDGLVAACADAGVAILLSGHTHTPTADVVELVAGGIRRGALALVTGTAISSRTRGVANAYEVIRLGGPMTDGASIEVSVRHSTAAGWSEVDARTFTYSTGGVVVAP